MSTNTEVKNAMLSMDKTLVDENNLEIPPNSIIHCLGSLFQVTDTGLRHIAGKKIDNDTYFVNSDLYIQLNELACVEHSDVKSTPDAAPKKEGLLTSAYRFMTAPFSVRTPSNVTTHNRRRKSSPNKLVCINNLATPAVPNISSDTEDVAKVPTPQEITRLDARCEKAVINEVKFFIHSYKEFMTCKSEKLQSVMHALNAANVERYNEVKVQYQGFMWDPPLIDINKLVTLVQRVYPAQVVEYTLGHGKKSSSETEDTDKLQVCSHLPNPKQIITIMRLSEILTKNSRLMKSMTTIEDHMSHQIGTVMTTGPGQDHRKTAHTGKDLDMTIQIEEIGMIAIQAVQIVVTIIS